MPSKREGWERSINRNSSAEVIVRQITASHMLTNNEWTYKLTNKLSMMKVYTHMTFRLESLASSLGIDPVSLLLFKRLSRQIQPCFSYQLDKLWDPKVIPFWSYGLNLSPTSLLQIRMKWQHSMGQTNCTKDGNIHESEWVEVGKWLGDSSGELVGIQIQADQIL